MIILKALIKDTRIVNSSYGTLLIADLTYTNIILILGLEKEYFIMGDLYLASDKRYEKMVYNRVGKSGLKFPAVSLGFGNNFGSKDNYGHESHVQEGFRSRYHPV